MNCQRLSPISVCYYNGFFSKKPRIMSPTSRYQEYIKLHRVIYQVYSLILTNSVHMRQMTTGQFLLVTLSYFHFESFFPMRSYLSIHTIIHNFQFYTFLIHKTLYSPKTTLPPFSLVNFYWVFKLKVRHELQQGVSTYRLYR
jgi:hypothetical protein